ncbi:MAG: helix-turn-helix transcriptional regulator [Acidimicrobiaceae bacterium]|nr:helix-turn-helix transcriptional regulator [Acidimicrobiaceae bacterium]
MQAGERLANDIAANVADAMFALATPSRVQILHILTAGPRTAGELTEGLGMEQSAVSHQLRILREHGLVRVERSGRRRMYSLADARVRVLFDAALDHVRETPLSRAPVEWKGDPPEPANERG